MTIGGFHQFWAAPDDWLSFALVYSSRLRLDKGLLIIKKYK
jgi:hypothetical protein